jgi:hypothetical protein
MECAPAAVPAMPLLAQAEIRITTMNFSHWLGDPSFPAQFMVKNVVCFSDIFH